MACLADVGTGLGSDSEGCRGFPADDCPDELPDLSCHHSLLATVLKSDPQVYHEAKCLRTDLGVGLARCIKTGIDNRSWHGLPAVGLVAGDEASYDTFRGIFDGVLRARHGQRCLEQHHPLPVPPASTSPPAIDDGRYVLSSQARCARNLRGLRFTPACSREERREVERVATRALMEMGVQRGRYFPLPCSRSYAAKPIGASELEVEELLSARLLFEAPDAPNVLSAGIGRDWPDARGVFASESKRFAVWVNEEEHLRGTVARPDADVHGALRELLEAFDGIASSLQRHSDGPDGFAHSARLGFLTAFPSSVGTGLRLSVVARLPLVAGGGDLTDWCARRRVTVRQAIDELCLPIPGVLEVASRETLGVTEAETADIVRSAVEELVRAERSLEQGGPGLALVSHEAVSSSAVSGSGTTPVAAAKETKDAVSWDAASQTLCWLIADAAETAVLEPETNPVVLEPEEAPKRCQAKSADRIGAKADNTAPHMHTTLCSSVAMGKEAPALLGRVPPHLLTKVLGSMAATDQRIGALRVMVAEAERQLSLRDADARKLTDRLLAAKRDSMELKAEIEGQEPRILEAERRFVKLQEDQLKLSVNLEEEALRQWHRLLDADLKAPSARSDVPTIRTARCLPVSSLAAAAAAKV